MFGRREKDPEDLDKQGGSEGTGFDDEVGDPGLEPGEMDVESSMSKEEEDAAEAAAEGKGIVVSIEETNRVTMSYQGKVVEEGQSTGMVTVSNSGSKNRINGIDLYLDNVGKVSSEEGLTEHTNIGMIKPGGSWNREYEFSAQLDVISVEQEFLDPETNLSPNFMDGRKPTFENRITITNNLDTPIYNVEGLKVLNEHASHVESVGEGVSFENATMEVTETVEAAVSKEPVEAADEPEEPETPEEPEEPDYEETMETEEDMDDMVDDTMDAVEDEMGLDSDDDMEEDEEEAEEEVYTETATMAAAEEPQAEEAEPETRTRMAQVVKFSIEEIGPGETVEIVIRIEASLPEDTPAYRAGDLSVTYQVQEFLGSGLAFKSVDGVSDIKQKIRKKQREEEPHMYDAEVSFENKSEFVYQIVEFEVRQNDINGAPIMEWKGSDASEDEREIVPGEKVVFEFVYDDVDRDGNPAFGQHLEFEVQEYHDVSSMFELNLPGENLKFMSLTITKVYLDENGEETKEFTIPSYVETVIPAKVTVTGVGTYPLDNVEVVEEIPAGFRFCDNEKIVVMRNGKQLSEDQYEVSFGSPQGSEESVEAGEDDEETVTVTADDLSGGSRMEIKLSNLQESEDGAFAQDEQITVDYCMVAENLEPQDDPIKTYAYAEGYIDEMPDSKVRDDVAGEDDLRFIVVHLRDDIDVSKYLQAISHDGGDAFVIQIEAENYGTSTQTLVIRDLVPSGFELVEGSMTSEPEIEVEGPESVSDGSVYTWTFANVAPSQAISASYKLVQTADDANPRMLQKVYQG
ncbi:MAG: hypothetical protein ACXAE3_03155 [Candidatus Kariarchaeaceae archaeon]|jgi:hypothetical protein